MRKDYGGRVVCQCGPDNFTRVDSGAINCSAEQLLESEDAVTVIQVEATEHLVFEPPDPRPQELAGVSGGW